jgi:hypothetical protein
MSDFRNLDQPTMIREASPREGGTGRSILYPSGNTAMARLHAEAVRDQAVASSHIRQTPIQGSHLMHPGDYNALGGSVG